MTKPPSPFKRQPHGSLRVGTRLLWRHAGGQRNDANPSPEISNVNSLAFKLVAEFIGTFASVFIGAGATAVVGDGVGLPESSRLPPLTA